MRPSLIVADESVDGQVVRALRAEGYQIDYIAESSPGSSDDDVLARAATGGAMLLTADKDFGELVYAQRRIGNGVVLVRFPGLSPEQKAVRVLWVFRYHGAELPMSFSVIGKQRVRIRHR